METFNLAQYIMVIVNYSSQSVIFVFVFDNGIWPVHLGRSSSQYRIVLFQLGSLHICQAFVASVIFLMSSNGEIAILHRSTGRWVR